MKKFLSVILVMLMAISMVACGKKNEGGTGDAVEIADSVTLLNAVWASYDEADKFPAGGGDYATEETTSEDGPGKFGIADTDALDAVLGLPASDAALIDDAASLSHMMNSNMFTCGAFRLTDASKAADFTKAYRDHIMDRQWICGVPDKMCVITVGNYVIGVFGYTENVDTFKAKVQAAYPSAVVAYEENVVE